MPRRTDTTIVAVKLRIREGLRKKLLREAEKAERSLNQELERRLERSFELEERLEQTIRMSEVLSFENARLKDQLQSMEREAAVAKRHKFDRENSQLIIKKLDEVRKLLGG